MTTLHYPYAPSPPVRDHATGTTSTTSTTSMRTSPASAATLAGIPAPYGRACANCARAKCRCIYRNDGAGCERCHRLQKDCRPSTPVRRRTVASKRAASSTLSRTAQLEQKLDGLVSLLTVHASERARANSNSNSNSNSGTNGNDGGSGSNSNSASSPDADPGMTPTAGFAVVTDPQPTPPDEYRRLHPGGPDFGRDIIPYASLPSTRTSSVSVREELSSCAHYLVREALAASHMPRTPESSTSSVPPGGQQQHQQQQEQQQQQQQQESEPELEPQHQEPQHQEPIIWAFECGSHPPRSRDIGEASGGAAAETTAARDRLKLAPNLEPTPAEAEQALHVFRTTMLPYFPFVHIPPELTAAQLRRSRPVLWLAVMAVTCQCVPTPAQLGRSTHLRALFAQRIVFDGEKSLDLLQALLVFLTWAQYTSRRDRPTLSVMSQLAVSLVADLGLQRLASPCKSLIVTLVRDQHQQVPLPEDPPPPPLDERRAALACYVLTSKYSLAPKRCEPLRWTTAFEEHLGELVAHAETPLDHVLAAQVRLQRVTDHIHLGEWQHNDPSFSSWAMTTTDRATGAETVCMCMPECLVMPPYVVSVVRAKIAEIRDSVPAAVRQHDGVLDALYASEMMVCAAAALPVVAPVAPMATTAAAMAARPQTKSSPSHAVLLTRSASTYPPAPSASSTALDFVRVAALDRCVEAVAAFWAFFRRITSSAYSALPFFCFAHFKQCVILLYALSVIDEPRWDRAAVRDRLQVVDMFDGFIAKLREAPRMGPATAVVGQEALDVFNRAASMLGSARQLWASNTGLADLRGAAATATAAGSETASSAATTATATATPAVPITSLALDESAATVGAAWQMSSVAAPAAASAPLPPPLPTMPAAVDTAMSEAPPQAPIMMPSGDMFFPEMLMDVSEDYMFWDLFLPGDESVPQL